MRETVETSSDVGSKQQNRHQILLREVNERVRDLVAPSLAGREQGEFLCECGDEACLETVRLAVEEYDAVRASPHRFVMIPGHEDGIGDVTVHGIGRFVVVERTAFGEQAALHDPRRRNGSR
jgi:hypothetical protein